MQVVDDLRYCVEYLATERFGADVAQKMVRESADDAQALFNAYRDLVNVREPDPVDQRFLTAQDRMLKERIEHTGITDSSELLRAPLDDRLALWRGDITTLRIDAIVNAANSRLLGCWVPRHYCIDNAIHSFAGVQLRAECARIMREQGYLEPTGMAKVTPAFNLPSKWVIHTVGPIANEDPSDEHRALLASCYRSCLEAAESIGAKSIAFCCISTGVFGFPQDEAAKIAVSTVRDWLDKNQSDKHVVFNVFEPVDEELYSDLLFG